MRFPPQGCDQSAVLGQLEALRVHDAPARGGQTMAYVYDPNRPDVDALAREVVSRFLDPNGLDPTTFPSVALLENDVIGMALEHLHAPEGAVGSFTSGGTESCLLAVKTARDFAQAIKGITAPELILPVTGHAAFHKAAHYFRLKLVPVEVDASSFRADPDAIRGAITKNTALIVASAVSYAQGVTDPIPEIGQVAQEHGIPLHVDGCIGGFLLPFFEELGEPVTPFDFRVPGVSSISMDLHKYAYVPKGASTLLYRDPAYRMFQYFATTEWPGYPVVNPTIQSSRTAAPLAAAWALLHYLGRSGYRSLASDILGATKQLIAGINALPGLHVLGQPEASLIAFTSSQSSVFALSDELAVRGWHVHPQFAHGASPENLHLTVTPVTAVRASAFLQALQESVEPAKAFDPRAILEPLSQELPALLSGPPGIEAIDRIGQLLGLEGTSLPTRRAPLNTVLNALPRSLVGSLLTGYFSDLFTPAP